MATAGVLGEGTALRFASETAIVWLRPDVAAAGAIGEVVGRIEAAGFAAVGAAVVRLGRADVRALWWWQLKRDGGAAAAAGCGGGARAWAGGAVPGIRTVTRRSA
jgi:hypothetical protein